MASQEEFNYAGLSDSAALCVAESTGDSTGALSFEVGGYNKLDGDIQKVTHQRKNTRTQMGVSLSLHVSQTHSGVSLLGKQSRVKPSKHLPVHRK